MAEFNFEKFVRAVEKAFEYLNEEENIPFIRWIPVSEKLPESGIWCLVTVKNPDGFSYLDIRLLSKYTGEWIADDESFGEVLAWMYLPKQYEEESEASNDKGRN